jgi:hypothetical protein
VLTVIVIVEIAILSGLTVELGERVSLAGVAVLESRITHHAYAPEVAQAMLARHQANAIVAARFKIVEGAVGMVQIGNPIEIAAVVVAARFRCPGDVYGRRLGRCCRIRPTTAANIAGRDGRRTSPTGNPYPAGVTTSGK